MRKLACLSLLWVATLGFAQDALYQPIARGTLKSVLASDNDTEPLNVPAFNMRVEPVTLAEFKIFLQANPEWQRSQAPKLFVDKTYLSDWQDDTDLPAKADAAEPVTQVSWFAAQAYCESEGARLPTWAEWEYVAAADLTHADARSDPAWLAKILDWYARPASGRPSAVGGAKNYYGVRDMHGLIWEWVGDFNALLVNPDSRSGDDPDKLKFCGAGAINLQDKQNYAVLMRIALLSSLQASDSTNSLGFRCVRPSP